MHRHPDGARHLRVRRKVHRRRPARPANSRFVSSLCIVALARAQRRAVHRPHTAVMIGSIYYRRSIDLVAHTAPLISLRAGHDRRSLLKLGLACVALAAVFAGLIIVLSGPLPDHRIAGYSSLWAVRGRGSSVEVGVSNSQLQKTSYRVEVIPAVGRRIDRVLSLRPGEQWSRLIQISRPSLQPVMVRLYLSTAPSRPYRQVALSA